MTATETISPRSRGLDSWPDEAILEALTDSQERAIAAVRAAHDTIAEAARAIVARIGDCGRIIYVGAGSSGVIAALDGMELGGTFGWPDERVAFVLPDGNALTPGMKNAAEDNATRGRVEMEALAPTPADAVTAVAASGSTTFTLAATDAARAAGALTIGLANNAGASLLRLVDVPVLLASGPEVIAGSTRLGAGTAQKAALGLLSSLTMIRLGHVYDGLMVDLRVDNAKLRKRALAILGHITGRDEAAAEKALDLCHGRVKLAALVAFGLAPDEAEQALAAVGGNLRAALAGLQMRPVQAPTGHRVTTDQVKSKER